jgi:hypothetical protein
MRIRFTSWLALGIAAAFLVVASTSFALFDIQNVGLGVAIGTLVSSLFVAYRYHDHIPSLVIGAVSAAVSVWTIVASQVFSLSTVQNLTLAEGLALAGLAIAGLTSHELSTERVVHSLTVEAGRDMTAHTGRDGHAATSAVESERIAA